MDIVHMQPYTASHNASDYLATSLDNIIAQKNPAQHTFLNRFAEKGMNKEALARFSAQWYKVITAHKHAFGGLIYNTPDENLRGDLVNILYDEYGLGNPEYMHTRLFFRVPTELGLNKEQIESTPELPQVRQFREEVNAAWVRGSPAQAYGMVYVFERTGAEFHRKVLDGLEKSGVSEHALTYSRLHAVAEEEHARIVINGLSTYRDEEKSVKEGAVKASQLMNNLWKGLEDYCYN